ncbi:MAG: YCF48-related protein [Ignavibacteria bacterium]
MNVKLSILVLFISFNSIVAQHTWYLQNSNTSSNLNSISFLPSSNTGYVCGSNGTILKTSNAGINWVTVIPVTANNLKFIQVNPGHIWVVGDNGVIIKSGDGGNSWILMNSGTTLNINSIDMRTSTTTGYSVCDNGVILHTSNGGYNWTSVLSPVTTNLNSIDRKYICGDNGVILYNNNGVWTREASVTIPNDLKYISSYSNGYRYSVCGENGVILVNYGGVWQTVNSNTNNNLNSIVSLGLYQPSIFLYSVGNSGTAIRSINSGMDWSSVNLPKDENINGVYFKNQFTGWVTGNNGVILKTERDFIRVKMDGNSISTSFSQNGSINFPGFEWPKGSGKYARYSSDLIIGAVVNNDTLVVSGDSGSGEFLPGYTNNSGFPVSFEDTLYRIYKIKNGTVDVDRLKWPNLVLSNSDQGAPVYFNSVSGMWEPNDYGNQTMFFRMTDSYPESHLSTRGFKYPLKADVKCVNYSFQTQNELDNVLYSHYEIINRSNNVWNKTLFTFFTQDDANDYIGYSGSDTVNNLGYSYCTANNSVYGNNGPAVGFKFIRGANFYTGNPNDTLSLYLGKIKRKIAGHKSKGMYSFHWFLDDWPDHYSSIYRSMEGKNFWTGEPIRTPEGIITRYHYSGDPETNTGWTMPNSVGAAYRRTYTTTGPVTVNPGDTQHIVIAQVIAQGVNNLNSVTKLKEASIIAEQNYNNFFEDVPIGIKNISSEVPHKFFLHQNYPNPFNPSTIIRFEISKQSFVTLKLYDITGREIALFINQNLNPGQYEYKLFTDVFNLASGVYFYKIEAGKFVQTRKMMVLK